MITSFKKRWEISHNWQLIYPILGIIAAAFSAYLIAKAILKNQFTDNRTVYYVTLLVMGICLYYLIIGISLWCFKKLKNKWKVNYRWEYIAIFLVFAVTGSSAGRISDPFMEIIGLSKETTNGWLYWPVRILLIFPVYQVLLVLFGWIFGQYRFFLDFAIKMASRMGFGFLFRKRQ